jgi:hypothetical protein
MHHDAITGTSPNKVVADFQGKTDLSKKSVHEMATNFLVEKLDQHHGIKVKPGKLDPSMEYWATQKEYTSPYSHYKQFMFVVSNPSQQQKEEVVEI